MPPVHALGHVEVAIAVAVVLSHDRVDWVGAERRARRRGDLLFVGLRLGGGRVRACHWVNALGENLCRVLHNYCV